MPIINSKYIISVLILSLTSDVAEKIIVKYNYQIRMSTN